MFSMLCRHRPDRGISFASSRNISIDETGLNMGLVGLSANDRGVVVVGSVSFGVDFIVGVVRNERLGVVCDVAVDVCSSDGVVDESVMYVFVSGCNDMLVSDSGRAAVGKWSAAGDSGHRAGTSALTRSLRCCCCC